MESTIVTINKVDLPIKEWNNQRVVTLKDIDRVHGRPEGTARKRFNDNKKHFIIGQDYIVRNSDEAKTEYGLKAPNGLTLLTESGYLMIVKSFQDDLAWEVQRQLVNSYFKLKEVSYLASEELPINIQSINLILQRLETNFKSINSDLNEVKQLVANLNIVQDTPKVITAKIQQPSDIIRDTIKPLAELYQDNSVGYNNTYRKVYAAMPVCWKNRQSRYRNAKGNKNNPSKFTLLENDKKLLSIFVDTTSKLINEFVEVN